MLGPRGLAALTGVTMFQIIDAKGEPVGQLHKDQRSAVESMHVYRQHCDLPLPLKVIRVDDTDSGKMQTRTLTPHVRSY